MQAESLKPVFSRRPCDQVVDIDSTVRHIHKICKAEATFFPKSHKVSSSRLSGQHHQLGSMFLATMAAPGYSQQEPLPNWPFTMLQTLN